MSEPHSPEYKYCPFEEDDPYGCCGTTDVIDILCKVCGLDWPCPTKRSHHSWTQNARVERWVEARLNRKHEWLRSAIAD